MNLTGIPLRSIPAGYPRRCRGRFAPSTTRCGWPSPRCSARSASQQADAADKPSGKHVCLRPCSWSAAR